MGRRKWMSHSSKESKFTRPLPFHSIQTLSGWVGAIYFSPVIQVLISSGTPLMILLETIFSCSLGHPLAQSS